MFFLLGQLYAQEGQTARAVAMLRAALDLAPRHSNYIRAALDRLESKLVSEVDEATDGSERRERRVSSGGIGQPPPIISGDISLDLGDELLIL